MAKKDEFTGVPFGRSKRRAKRYRDKLFSFPKTEKRAMADWMRRNPTPGEMAVASVLYGWGAGGKRLDQTYRWRRQVIRNGYVLDFYCDALRLVIEVDGRAHLDPQRAALDAIKDTSLARVGLKVVRLPWPFADKPRKLLKLAIASRAAELAALNDKPPA